MPFPIICLQIDMLICNAGRSQRAIWENIDVTVDRELFELNVFSLISLSRVVVKKFLAQGFGHIAATSSLAGVFPVPFSASYVGSKHAIHVSITSQFFITNIIIKINLLYKNKLKPRSKV